MRFRGAMALACGLLALFLAAYALLWSREAARSALYDTSFWVFSGLAAASLFRAAGWARRTASSLYPAWLSLAVSQLLFACGDVVWGVWSVLGMASPFPSLADLFYAASYVPFLIAVFFLPGRLVRPHDRTKMVIDIALIVMAASAVLTSLCPAFSAASHQGWATALLSILRIALDLAVVLAVSLILLAGHGHGDNRPLLLVAAGTGLRAVMDTVLGHHDIIGHPVSGGIEDVGWLVSYALIGLSGAALVDNARDGRIVSACTPRGYGEGAWGRYLPHMAAASAFACLLWRMGSSPPPPIGLAFMVGLVLVLATLREWVIASDNLRLAAVAERELVERQGVEERLRAANEALEDRVTERTRALRVTNESLRAEIADHTRVEDELRVRDFALASSLNAIVLCDLDGRITYTNPAFTTMWACTGDEAVGRSLGDFWFSRDAARTVLGTVRDTGRWDGEVRARRLSGDAFDVQVSASVVRDALRRPVCLMAVFLDITLRHRADAVLHSRLRYEEALAEVAGLLLAQAGPPSPLQAVVTRLLQVSGASRVYIFENFTDHADGLCTRQVFEACAPGVEPQIGNAALQHFPFKRGFQRWVEELSAGRPINGRIDEFPAGERSVLQSQSIAALLVLPLRVGGGWYGFLGFDDTVHERTWAAEDIRLLETAARLIAGHLERHRVEEALSAAAARWQATFDSVGDGICLLGADQRIQQCNAAFANLVGVPRDACGGRFCWELVHKSNRPYPDCPVTRASRSLHRELMELVQDARVYEVVADPLVNPTNGSYAGAVHTVRDLTDRKRAEDERRRLEVQVQHSQKLESLAQMAGGIAHDFNNILTTILGNADLAAAETAENTPVREHLQQIEDAGRRAADLCRQLLAYSGHGRFTVELIDLNALLTDLTPVLQAAVPQYDRIEYRMAENLQPIEGDASQVRQIILNLVTNASEAVGDTEGIIRITTGRRTVLKTDMPEAWAKQGLGEGDYVALYVEDRGCGITPEALPRIFDPFYSTKFMGRGLGLSAVLGIVRGHGGTIEVDSHPNEGTTVRIFIPAAPVSAVRTPAQPASGQMDWKGHGTVLVVDDESTLRTLASHMLSRLGFQVVTARDGREGVDAFARQADDITCILLDLTMPRMAGEQAFREIRKLSVKVPIILCSGYSENDVAPRFAGLGLAGFLQKPYQFSTLQAKLREVLA